MIPTATFERALDELLMPIAALLHDDAVSEVMVNGPGRVFSERAGQLVEEPMHFDSEASLLAALRVMAQFVGRPFDEAHPILEGRLPGGARVEAIHHTLAADGSQLTLRKFHSSGLDFEALVECGALSPAMRDTLMRAVSDKKNVLVSGGTGSGKTSLLGALARQVPPSERIVLLEDARELAIVHPHVVSLEARPADSRGAGAVTIRQLLRATLRLRPDRIILGEIRDGAALDLLQALTSGHGGGMATIHASHPGDALARLETLALFADSGLPLAALRQQIASAIDLVVQVERLRTGRRVVAGVAAVVGLHPEQGFRWSLLHAHPGAHPWFRETRGSTTAGEDSLP
jgi:pilus assembly protein CpaF